MKYFCMLRLRQQEFQLFYITLFILVIFQIQFFSEQNSPEPETPRMSAAWSPQTAPLMTRWAAQVTNQKPVFMSRD